MSIPHTLQRDVAAKALTRDHLRRALYYTLTANLYYTLCHTLCSDVAAKALTRDHLRRAGLDRDSHGRLNTNVGLYLPSSVFLGVPRIFAPSIECVLYNTDRMCFLSIECVLDCLLLSIECVLYNTNVLQLPSSVFPDATHLHRGENKVSQVFT